MDGIIQPQYPSITHRNNLEFFLHDIASPVLVQCTVCVLGHWWGLGFWLCVRPRKGLGLVLLDNSIAVIATDYYTWNLLAAELELLSVKGHHLWIFLSGSVQRFSPGVDVRALLGCGCSIFQLFHCRFACSFQNPLVVFFYTNFHIFFSERENVPYCSSTMATGRDV